MKVDVAAPIVAYDGTPFESTEADGHTEVLTIRWAIRTVLNAPLPQEPWTPDSMLECARISRAVYRNEVVDLDEGVRTLIKERSGKVCATAQFGPMVHAVLIDVLSDPAEPERTTGTTVEP